MPRPSDDDDRGSAQASTGQIIVMFALFLVGLMGMLGLAMDLGFAFAERRTMQNAADAGALAGARVLTKSSSTLPLSALSDVTSLVNQNKIGATNPTVTSCAYVNDADTDVGACAATVPSAATGVRVAVSETHATFFIRVVPGAPSTVTTTATAIAHVLMISAPTDGPYLPCAVNTQLAAGGSMNILNQSGTTWVLNPAADGQTFIIHGPKIEKCQAKASRYKGVADQAANRTKTFPAWFNYKEGDTAGPVSVDVDGPDGCKAGQEVVNCVAFLPIVVDNPPESGNNKELWTVAFAPFYITEPKSNEHYGKLLSSYIIIGTGQTGQPGWTQGYTGPIVIRLTG